MPIAITMQITHGTAAMGFEKLKFGLSSSTKHQLPVGSVSVACTRRLP